jgi:hypothetical protein
MLARISGLHSRLQLTILLVLGGLLLWGLICAARRRVDPGFVASIWIAQLLLLAQAGLGFMLLIRGPSLLGLALHLIYALIAIAILPASLRYTHTMPPREAALTLTGMCFVLLIVVARAAETM